MRAHKHLDKSHKPHECGHGHDHHGHHHHHIIGNAAHYLSQKASDGNEWIGNKFGGRANSGRVGRTTRVIRGITNTTAVGIGVAGVLLLGISVVSGGLAAPLWILISGFLAVAINLAAVVIGSGANHLKISQYYDALVEINAENGRLLELNGEKRGTLPHGIKEYWKKDRKLFDMTLKRRGQESFSVAGTAMSGALMLSALGSFAVAPSAAAGLFFASRGVSCATTAGSAYNTKDRLTIYKEIIYRFGQQYIEVTGKHNCAKQAQALEIVSKVFTRLKIPTEITDITNERQWRTFNIAHSVYKMLFSQSENFSMTDKLAFLNPDNQQQVLDGIVARLQTLIKKDNNLFRGQASRYFSRAALRKIDAIKQYSVDDELSILDAMPVLRMQLETDINKKLIVNSDASERVQVVTRQIISDLNININKDNPHKTLAFFIKKAAVQGVSAGHENAAIIGVIKTCLQQYLAPEIVQKRNTGCLVLDTGKLSKEFPVQGNAHGSGFLPSYHLSRLADIIVEAAKDTRHDLQEQNHSHHHDHEKCSGYHHHHDHEHKPGSRPILQSHNHKSCSGHNHQDKHQDKHSETGHAAGRPPPHSWNSRCLQRLNHTAKALS
jgi:hypothetical protein